jgi:hypothetical protein
MVFFFQGFEMRDGFTFVDIGEIVNHHCLRLYFHIYISFQANEKITERLSEFSQKVTTGDKGVDKDYIEYLVNMVKSKE